MFTPYELEQMNLIASHVPYDLSTVMGVFSQCSKSFDTTVKALELGAAYNDLHKGITEANKARHYIDGEANYWLHELCTVTNHLYAKLQADPEYLGALRVIEAQLRRHVN